MKSSGLNDAQFLDLLQKVLPQATPDPRLAAAIYERVAQEVRLINHLKALDKLCAEGALPDLEPETLGELQSRLATNFGEANVSLQPNETGDTVAVEVVLPDRQVSRRLKVLPPGAEPEDDLKVPYVPFPVALPEDPDLLWVLARREDLAPAEASRALLALEEEFWETKAGLKMLRDRVEKTFAEFIARVPARALADHGLKRHYKAPETRQTLHRFAHTREIELEEIAGVAVPASAQPK